MQKNDEFLERNSDKTEQGQQSTAWDELKNVPMAVDKIESKLKDDLANIQDMLKHGKISQEQADIYTKEVETKAESAKHPDMDADTKKALDDDLANIQDMLEHGKITQEQADKYTKEVEDKAINEAYRKSNAQSTQDSQATDSSPAAPQPTETVTTPVRHSEEAKLDAMLKEVLRKDSIAPEKKIQFKSEADMDAALEYDGPLTKEEEQAEVAPKKKIVKKIIRRKIIKKVPTTETQRQIDEGQAVETSDTSEPEQQKVAEEAQQREAEEEQQKESELQEQQTVEEQHETEEQQSGLTDAELNEELSRRAEQFLAENQDFEDRIIRETEKGSEEREKLIEASQYSVNTNPELSKLEEELSDIDRELAELDAQDSIEKPQEGPKTQEKKGIFERIKDFISEINRINREIAELDEEIDEEDEGVSEPSEATSEPEAPNDTANVPEAAPEPSEEAPEASEEPSEEPTSEESPETPAETPAETPEEAAPEPESDLDRWTDDIKKEIEENQDLIGGSEGVENFFSTEGPTFDAFDHWDDWWDRLSEEGKQYIRDAAHKVRSSGHKDNVPWGWGFRTWLGTKN